MVKRVWLKLLHSIMRETTEHIVHYLLIVYTFLPSEIFCIFL